MVGGSDAHQKLAMGDRRIGIFGMINFSPKFKSEDYPIVQNKWEWNDKIQNDRHVRKGICSDQPPQSDRDGVDDLSEINQGRSNLLNLPIGLQSELEYGTFPMRFTVRQTENVNDLYYLAPYDVQNKSITFSWEFPEIRIMITSDLSLDMKIPQFYRFAWTKSESSGGGGPTDGWNLYKMKTALLVL